MLVSSRCVLFDGSHVDSCCDFNQFFLQFLSVIFLFVWRKGRVSRRGICLVGLCESGKTLIFSQLIYKKAVESFTSMKENVGVLDIANKVKNNMLYPNFLFTFTKYVTKGGLKIN